MTNDKLYLRALQLSCNNNSKDVETYISAAEIEMEQAPTDCHDLDVIAEKIDELWRTRGSLNAEIVEQLMEAARYYQNIAADHLASKSKCDKVAAGN